MTVRDHSSETTRGATSCASLDQFTDRVVAHLERLNPTILEHFRNPSGVSLKPDQSIVTATDMYVEESLTPLLRELLPDLYVVGEETADRALNRYDEALSHTYVAAVDAIDGTQNFSHGVPLFATSVGLLERTATGHTCARGIVLFPAQREIYFEKSGVVFRRDLVDGSTLALSPVARAPNAQSIVSVLDNHVDKLPLPRPGEVHTPRIFGCVVADLMYIARGALAGTVSDYALWDFAGSLALAQKLGVYMFDPITGEKKDTFVASDFERGSLKRQWCLQYPYLVCHQDNLAAMMGRFRV